MVLIIGAEVGVSAEFNTARVLSRVMNMSQAKIDRIRSTCHSVRKIAEVQQHRLFHFPVYSTQAPHNVHSEFLQKLHVFCRVECGDVAGAWRRAVCQRC